MSDKINEALINLQDSIKATQAAMAELEKAGLKVLAVSIDPLTTTRVQLGDEGLFTQLFPDFEIVPFEYHPERSRMQAIVDGVEYICVLDA